MFQSSNSGARRSNRTQRPRINLFDNDYTDDAPWDFDLPSAKKAKLYDPPKENAGFAVVIYRTPTPSQEPQSQTRTSVPPPGLKEENDEVLSPTLPPAEDDEELNCSQEQLGRMELAESSNLKDTQESQEVRASPRPRGRPRKTPVASDFFPTNVQKAREGTPKTPKVPKAGEGTTKAPKVLKAGTNHAATPPPSLTVEKKVRFNPETTKDNTPQAKESPEKSPPITKPPQRWRAVRVPSGGTTTPSASSAPSTTVSKATVLKTPDTVNPTKEIPSVPAQPAPRDEDVTMEDVDDIRHAVKTEPEVATPTIHVPVSPNEDVPMEDAGSLQDDQLLPKDTPTANIRPQNAPKPKKAKPSVPPGSIPAAFIDAEKPNFKKCKFCETIVIHGNNLKFMELHLRTEAHRSKEEAATAEVRASQPSSAIEQTHPIYSRPPVPAQDKDIRPTALPPNMNNQAPTLAQVAPPSSFTDRKYNNIFVQSASPGFVKCKFCKTQLFQADSADALDGHLKSQFHHKQVAAAGYTIAPDGSLHFKAQSAQPAEAPNVGRPHQTHDTTAHQPPIAPALPVKIPFGFVGTDNPNEKTCGVCRDGLRIPISNMSIMEMHVNSKSHKEKLANLTASVTAVTAANAPAPTEPTPLKPPTIPEGFIDTDSRNEKTCGVCRDRICIPVSDIEMMERHVKSESHREKLAALEATANDAAAAAKPNAFSSRMAEPQPSAGMDIAPPPTGRMFATTIVDQDAALSTGKSTPKALNAKEPLKRPNPPAPKAAPTLKTVEAKKKLTPSRPLSKPRPATKETVPEGSRQRLSASTADPMLVPRKRSTTENSEAKSSASASRPLPPSSPREQVINPLTGKLELVKPSSNRNKNEALLNPTTVNRNVPEPPKQRRPSIDPERVKIAKERLLGLRNFWKIIRRHYKEEHNFLQWYTAGKVDENINKRAKDISFTNFNECKHLIEETGFKDVLERMLATKRVITDMARDDIRALQRKFFEDKNFGSANLPYDDLAGDDDLSDSDDEAEPGSAQANTAATAPSPLLPPGDMDRITTGPFRDIIIGVNKRGGRKYELHKNAEKKPADVYGHNGLTVGDWWPLQKCCLRDGAHGSNMGGIYGRFSDGKGAFSVVASGGYNDNNVDSGNVIWYSGSGGMTTKSGKASAKQVDNQGETLGNKSLVRSKESGRPVRVIRSSKLQSSWAPTSGFRYDGLYYVTSFKKVMNSGFFHYSFKLERLEDQPPIDQNRPTRAEVREVQKYVPSFT